MRPSSVAPGRTLHKGRFSAILLAMLKQLTAIALCTILGSTAMATEYGKTLIVGHRGEPFIAPENTMASFNLAFKNHDAAVETDIHLTKDDKIVLCHDPDVYRTSGNKVHLKLKDATLAEIQKVDVGSFKGPEWAGQPCPSLDQLFEALPSGTMCYVEIKSGLDVVPAFVDFLKKSGKGPEQIVVISFKDDALEASKKALPGYKHYFLANYKKNKKTGKYQAHPNVDDFIATAKRINADGLDLQAADPLDEAACKKIIDAGLELHIWTVDEPEVAKRYIDWGAKSITTNRSHWLKGQLTAMDKK
jgi:glycerophosphoryl diester phosphodiesterase